MNEYELPLSFVMALAQNERAMARFSSLTDTEKKLIIKHTQGVKSKSEMRSYVNNMFSGPGI